MYTDKNALDLNCHFYVVKARLENKMYVKGAKKMYQASLSSPTLKMNQIARSKQQAERIRHPDKLIVQMKRGKQNLKRV